MGRFFRITAALAAVLPCAAPFSQADAFQASAPEAAVQAPGYLLAPGDKLHVIVFGEENLTGTYEINSDGNIAFPLVGNVPAKGHDVDQLADEIKTKLASGYVQNPHVSAEVINYRPYYLLGEVTKSGEFPYEVGLTVEQAVAAAGGYTYRANRRYAYVRHSDNPVEIRVSLRGAPVFVKPGDTIRVGERFF